MDLHAPHLSHAPTSTPPHPQWFLSDTLLCSFLPPASLVIPQPPLGAMVSHHVILQPQACSPRPREGACLSVCPPTPHWSCMPATKAHVPSPPQVEFFHSALASAEDEQARLRGQLKEQKLRCQRLSHLAAAAQDRVEKETPAPRIGGDSVPAEAHQALQVAMDKLQVCELPPSRVQEGWGALWEGRC